MFNYNNNDGMVNKEENKNSPLVILNLWGSPGAGKRMILAGLYHELSRRNFSVEMLPVDFNPLSGEKKSTLLHIAEIYNVMGKMRENGVQYLITDFPLPLGIYYDTSKNMHFRSLVMDLFNSFSNINFYIEREKSATEEIEKMDKDLRNILVSSSIPFVTVPSRDPLPVILDSLTEHRMKEQMKFLEDNIIMGGSIEE